MNRYVDAKNHYLRSRRTLETAETALVQQRLTLTTASSHDAVKIWERAERPAYPAYPSYSVRTSLRGLIDAIRH